MGMVDEHLAVELGIFWLNLLLQSTLLLGSILILASLFRRKPVLRHTLLASGLFCCIFLPAPLLDMSGGGQGPAPYPPAVFPEIARDGGGFTGQVADRATSTMASSALLPAYSLQTLPAGPWLAGSGQILSVLWLAGFLLLSQKLLLAYFQLGKIRKRSVELAPSQERRIQALLPIRASPARKLKLRESGEVASPFTAGHFNPIIIFPRGMVERLDDTQLRGILYHEAAHIERHDYLRNFMQLLIQHLLWIHPLVHIVSRQVNQTREEICDNHALKQLEPLHYGETLLYLQNLIERKALYQTSIPILGQEWTLEKRIRDLLDQRRDTSVRLKVTKSAAIFCTTLAATLLVAICQVTAETRNDLPAASPIPSSNGMRPSPAIAENAEAETELPGLVDLAVAKPDASLKQASGVGPSMPAIEFRLPSGDIASDLAKRAWPAEALLQPDLALPAPALLSQLAPLVQDSASASEDKPYRLVSTSEPSYPSRAHQRGIEGWCLLEFDLSATGEVDGIEVIDASPPGVFNRSSEMALEKFRFSPEIRDGRPVPVKNLRLRFTFEIQRS